MQLPKEVAQKVQMDGGLIDRIIATAQGKCGQEVGGRWVV